MRMKYAIPEGLFKVFSMHMHKDMHERNFHKKVCILTVYCIDHSEAQDIYRKLEELNPNLRLHYTFTING